MVQYIASLDARSLVPPLLACLPTAFASNRPPPALLPLLSPILRQRVRLLSSNTSPSSGAWLQLLSWNQEHASALPGIVEKLHLEPHPVSGEIEVRYPDVLQYRRLDIETLHCQVRLQDLGLVAIYLWCEVDDIQPTPQWKLSELLCDKGGKEVPAWFPSIEDANQQATEGCSEEAAMPREPKPQPIPEVSTQDEDEDAYWASYDKTPGRTPAKLSPALRTQSQNRLPDLSELQYFERYATEVQPAMDPYDPDEADALPIDLSSKREAVSSTQPEVEARSVQAITPEGDDGMHRRIAGEEQTAAEEELFQPRSSSASSTRESVQRLEHIATAASQAELGIKQHISTDIKSLYRLAKSAGIQREEFERIVRTELDCLSMMDME